MKASCLTSSWRMVTSVVATASVALFGSVLSVRSAVAQTTYGTLSNFDVFNDTGQDCHGFEIELDGISSSNVTYTFGAPYERYGNPQIVDDPANNRVFVRYESPYNMGANKFTETTPQAPSPITPTNGHACWTGGSGNYLTAGCEHFGLGLTANPTNVVYHWLVEDLANPGHLTPLGSKVSIPAPIWNVAPPPAANQPPIVQAVVPAEPPEVETQCDDAQWVKVFTKETEVAPELAALVSSNPEVPQGETEIETEWTLFQHCPGEVNPELDSGEKEIGAGKKAVTRRYEVYKYTGAYSAEHEALCGDPTVEDPANCGEPFVNGLNGVGDYIGAQMAAIDLALGPLALASSPLPTGEHGLRYSTALITNGTPPYAVQVLKGAFPSGLDVDLNTGFLSGTPDGPAKLSTIKLKVMDSADPPASVADTVKVKIVKEVHISTAKLKVGTVQKSYKAKLKAAGGQTPYNWSLIDGILPDGITLDSATGEITGVPMETGTFPLTFQVTDNLGGTDPQDLTLVVK